MPQQHLSTPSHGSYQQSPLAAIPQPQPAVIQAKTVLPQPKNISTSVRSSSKPTPPPAKKLKTTNKKGANFSKKTEEWEAENGSEDDEYNMDGMKTKSGRKVHKPSQFNPSAKTPSKKRGAPGKKVIIDSLFCKVCERGHSPKSNLIVFCDGCNTPYHQLCHMPVIDNLLITLPDAEWFCATCDARRGQQKLEMGDNGSSLTEEQKKSYLASLPISHLVQLVLHAHSHDANLGLFSPRAAKMLEAVHKKHEAAIEEERSKMIIPIYQPVLGDDLPLLGSQDGPLMRQILTAVSKLGRPVQNRDIMEYIESNYVVDPSNFRVNCAAQISRCVADGRLEKDGTLISLPDKHTSSSTFPANGSNASEKGKGRKNGGTNLQQNFTAEQAFVEERYPQIEGIKLPAPSVAEDGFSMNETTSPAFVHALHTQENTGTSLDQQSSSQDVR